MQDPFPGMGGGVFCIYIQHAYTHMPSRGYGGDMPTQKTLTALGYLLKFLKDFHSS